MTARLPDMEEPRWGGPLLPGAIVLDADELRQAGDALIPGEDPEQGWIRYLRALALLALRRWLKQRKASVVVGPEIEPEDPDRLLAIGGRATQLLCASALAEEVAVQLKPWEQIATSPQLALLALVDEENGVVEFPGVLDASGMVAEIRKLRDRREQEPMELPVSLFQGGLERLLRWITLLEPGALPRRGRRSTDSLKTTLEKHLRDWIETLMSNDALMIPITSLEGTTRGISFGESNPIFTDKNRMVQKIRLLSPAMVHARSNEYVASAACTRPTVWVDTELAEIQIWHNSELVWRQQAKVDEPIRGPIEWPIEDLGPMDNQTICLRPYGSKVGDQAVFTLSADEQVQAQLNEDIMRHYLQDTPDASFFASETNASPELVAEFMARAALRLSTDGSLYNDHDFGLP